MLVEEAIVDYPHWTCFGLGGMKKICGFTLGVIILKINPAFQN